MNRLFLLIGVMFLSVMGCKNSDVAEEYYLNGITHLKIENYNAAISDFTRAIELKPDYAEAYNERANAKYDGMIVEKDSPWAWEDYQTAIDLKPDFGKAYYDRGYRKNYQESNMIRTSGCPDLCKAIELGYTAPDVYPKFECNCPID